MLFCFRNRPGYAGSILASLLLTAVGFSLFSIREHSHEYPLPLPARARG
jgi:fucose permease